MNRNAPASFLRKLFRIAFTLDTLVGGETLIKCMIAMNENTPANILAKLAKDKDDYVRKSVAENPNTPAKILAKLAMDKSQEVRRAAVRNPNAPADVLRKLVRIGDYYVITAMTGSRNTPTEILKMIAAYNGRIIKEAIAENPTQLIYWS
ncbi:MAG: hypothetical protein QXR62_04400 [Candidatus Bathyarchaeia archaeon]